MIEHDRLAPSSSLVLLTTCHLERDGIADLLKLVGSAEQALESCEISTLRHIILLQGCTAARRDEISSGMPDWAELLSTVDSVSSPSARNLMIHYLLEGDGFDPDAIVAFPDDDAHYPLGALRCIARHFRDGGSFELLVCR